MILECVNNNKLNKIDKENSRLLVYTNETEITGSSGNCMSIVRQVARVHKYLNLLNKINIYYYTYEQYLLNVSNFYIQAKNSLS